MPGSDAPLGYVSNRRRQWTAAAVLAAATAASWAWIVPMARDMYGPMTGPSAWMMAATWDLRYVLLLWTMWGVMMAAMMLPSAAPLLLLYAGMGRRQATAGPARLGVYGMALGYLLVWLLFSAGATALQRLLSGLLLLTPMMEPARPWAGGALRVLAGAYQLTPLKGACLRQCRSPIAFLMPRWRTGTLGAVRMGEEHGAYCLGCCWALMLLLFAGGVMNLQVIVALTLFELVEKTAPFGMITGRIAGAVLIALGVWMILA